MLTTLSLVLPLLISIASANPAGKPPGHGLPLPDPTVKKPPSPPPSAIPPPPPTSPTLTSTQPLRRDPTDQRFNAPSLPSQSSPSPPSGVQLLHSGVQSLNLRLRVSERGAGSSSTRSTSPPPPPMIPATNAPPGTASGRTVTTGVYEDPRAKAREAALKRLANSDARNRDLPEGWIQGKMVDAKPPTPREKTADSSETPPKPTAQNKRPLGIKDDNPRSSSTAAHSAHPEPGHHQSISAGTAGVASGSANHLPTPGLRNPNFAQHQALIDQLAHQLYQAHGTSDRATRHIQESLLSGRAEHAMRTGGMEGYLSALRAPPSGSAAHGAAPQHGGAGDHKAPEEQWVSPSAATGNSDVFARVGKPDEIFAAAHAKSRQQATGQKRKASDSPPAHQIHLPPHGEEHDDNTPSSSRVQRPRPPKLSKKARLEKEAEREQRRTEANTKRREREPGWKGKEIRMRTPSPSPSPTREQAEPSSPRAGGAEPGSSRDEGRGLDGARRSPPREVNEPERGRSPDAHTLAQMPLMEAGSRSPSPGWEIGPEDYWRLGM